jgi:hypothetical protein
VIADSFDPKIARLLRDLAPQVLGAVARRYPVLLTASPGRHRSFL